MTYGNSRRAHRHCRYAHAAKNRIDGERENRSIETDDRPESITGDEEARNAEASHTGLVGTL